MLPESTDLDGHYRTDIGLIYKFFEVLSAAQDGRE